MVDAGNAALGPEGAFCAPHFDPSVCCSSEHVVAVSLQFPTLIRRDWSRSEHRRDLDFAGTTMKCGQPGQGQFPESLGFVTSLQALTAVSLSSTRTLESMDVGAACAYGYPWAEDWSAYT